MAKQCISIYFRNESGATLHNVADNGGLWHISRTESGRYSASFAIRVYEGKNYINAYNSMWRLQIKFA